MSLRQPLSTDGGSRNPVCRSTWRKLLIPPPPLVYQPLNATTYVLTSAKSDRLLGARWPATAIRWANNRPTIAVLPFKLIGEEARGTGGLAEEISPVLLRVGWIAVVASDRAKYHLCGKIRDLGGGLLRATSLLLDIATGRYVWADHCDSDISSLHERIAVRIAYAVE